MKTSIVLFAFAIIISLSGCITPDAKCDLSVLKIKSVVLEGDTTGLVTSALKTELFARGATWTSADNGIKIVGKVTMNSTGHSPLYLVAQAEGQPFAGTAYSSFVQPYAATNQLARRVALDFCRCKADGSAIRKLSLRKE